MHFCWPRLDCLLTEEEKVEHLTNVKPRLPARLGAPFVLLALAGAFSALDAQPFWPQFRGPNGQGVTESAHPPVTFSPSENVIWATEVPPGHSSPCIWGKRIFLSTFQGDALQCRAYDRATGKLVWSRDVPAKKIEPTHAFSNPAAPTPAANGHRVVFYFGSYGLLCFSHEGKEIWRKELPPPVSRGSYGSATSPILLGDLLIQNLDTDEGGSRLLALKVSTGGAAWETPRPLFRAGWSTPAVWTRKGQSAIVVLGSKMVAAYNASNGAELWSVPGFPLETAPSIAVGDGLVFACAAGIGGRSSPMFEGTHWADLMKLDQNKDGKLQKSEVPKDYLLVQRAELPEGHPGRLLPWPFVELFDGFDKDKNGELTEEEWNTGMASFASMDTPIVMALHADGARTNGEERIAWKHSRGIPEVPTPLCYQHKLFLVRDGGLLQCLDAASGSVLYEDRVGEGGGYSASPIGADGRVYLASQSGAVIVVDATAKELKVLARNVIGEKITATPAPVENVLYVRTDQRLFAFGRK
jgi:outer membrane protein assembly factor BamB